MDEKLIKTYGGIVLITVAGLLVINALNISYPLQMTTSARSSELSVVGEGKVAIVPDTASITVGISVANEPSVETAQKKIDTVNNAIIAAMKNIGVDKKDIATSNYSIYPDYNYDTGKQEIKGYSGTVTVTIKTKHTELVSQIIQSATTAGANQVQGVQFSVDDPAKYREQAREEAIKNAREQAQKLSRELGLRLGRVVNIVETSPQGVVPMFARSLEADAIGGEGPTIEPGSQEITSTVTLYFEKR